MTAPSAKAREISEAWLPAGSERRAAVRAELAALIDAHMADVRAFLTDAMEAHAEGANSVAYIRAALAALTPEATP